MLDALNHFHFIRPLWLLALLLTPLLLVLTKAQTTIKSDWNKAINPEFLKHLTPKEHVKSDRHSAFLLILLFALIIIALAGPAWKQKPTPVIQTGNDVVIILDLSLSVLATDLSPDRLTKAKQKLQDLLNLRKEGNTALIAFSGDAHVVTPLTDDVQTIMANMKALDPFIMPVIGSRPDKAVKLAIKLFEQAKSQKPGIILITDGVEDNQTIQISRDLTDYSSPIPLSILAIGTNEGGPIAIPGQGYLKDKGQVILPKLELSKLSQLADSNSGITRTLTLDDSDIKAILSQVSTTGPSNEKQEDTQQRFFDTYEDMGFLLLLIIIPLSLIAFRKNILIALVLVIILPNEKSYAFEWKDLWQTKDQQANHLFNDGKLDEAAELFLSPEHKANAFYKAGKYKEAESIYRELTKENPSNLYNMGNSLAKQNKLEEALQAYNKALENNPKHEDALFNKQLVEKMIEQQKKDQQNQDQQNQDQQNQDQQNKDQQNKDQQNKDQQNKDQQNKDQQNKDQQNQDQQNKDQQNQDQQNKDQQNQDQQNQDQQNQDQQNQDQQSPNQQKKMQDLNETEEEKNEEREEREQKVKEQMSQRDNLTDEEKQSYEQWMRRVPDDPGALLRRKFEQQAQERARTQGNMREEGEPIW